MRFHPLLLGLALILPLLGGGAALAQPAARIASVTPFRITEAGLGMTLPDGWKSAKQGNAYVVFPSDRTITVTFIIEDAAQYEAHLPIFKKALSQRFTNFKSNSAATPGTVNGLVTSDESGTAESKGGPVIWRVMVVRATRPVFAYALMHAKEKKHLEEYAALMQSLQKI